MIDEGEGVEQVRAWLTEQSLRVVAQTIGCEVESVLRYVHGAPIRRGTVALITQALAQRATPVTTAPRAARRSPRNPK